jgi:hypothetical protein
LVAGRHWGSLLVFRLGFFRATMQHATCNNQHLFQRATSLSLFSVFIRNHFN